MFYWLLYEAVIIALDNCQWNIYYGFIIYGYIIYRYGSYIDIYIKLFH